MKNKTPIVLLAALIMIIVVATVHPQQSCAHYEQSADKSCGVSIVPTPTINESITVTEVPTIFEGTPSVTPTATPTPGPTATPTPATTNAANVPAAAPATGKAK
jgi:hypothetical protein